ncbi:MAG: hypothetical protein L0323_23100, partial [Planctomycetes bacterium]|nr:hypothetical protein [Planctomycetota bacterium]
MGRIGCIASVAIALAAAGGPAGALADLALLDVLANDLAYDPVRDDLVVAASVASPQHAASLLWVDPQTGAVEEEIPLGEDPGALAVSDGASRLFVSFRSVNEVWRFDLATREKDLVIDLGVGPSPFFNTLHAVDIAPVPGAPDSVAVSLTEGWKGTFHSVAVYDGAVRRPTTTSSSDWSQVLEFGADPAVLYGLFNGTAQTNFFTMAVDPSGVTVASAVNSGGLGQGMHESEGLLYGVNGDVYDPVQGVVVGSFGDLAAYSRVPFSDVAPGMGADPVVFALEDGLFRAFDRATRLPTGKYRAAVELRSVARRVVRCGPDVLACAYEGYGGAYPGRVGILRQSAFVDPETPDDPWVQVDGGGGLLLSWYDASPSETGFEI